MRTRFAGLDERDVQRHLAALVQVRDTVLDNARLGEGDAVVDVGAGTGLLTLGALDRIGPGGTVFAVDPSVDALQELRRHVTRGGVYYLLGDAEVLPLPDRCADAALTRSVLIYVDDLHAAALELHRVLRPGGRLSVFEPLNRYSTYIYNTVEWPEDLARSVHAEGDAYMSRDSGLVALDENLLAGELAAAGFETVELDVREEQEEWEVTRASADARLDAVPAAGEPSLRDRWHAAFAPDQVERLVAHLHGLEGTTVAFRRVALYLAAVGA